MSVPSGRPRTAHRFLRRVNFRAEHSILRFRSGLINTGMMAFTAGNNYVTGNVLNADVPASVDDGIITITGPGTKVTFEEDLLNVGTLNVGPGVRGSARPS